MSGSDELKGQTSDNIGKTRNRVLVYSFETKKPN